MGETNSYSAATKAVKQWLWQDIPACPICGCEKRRHFHKYVVDLEHHFVQCVGCDVLYLAPRPVYDDSFISDLYELPELADPDGDPIKASAVVGSRYRSQEIVSQISHFHPEKGSFLDVGCNRGHLLRAAAEAGWKASGVDISQSMVDYCRTQGLDAVCEDITASNADDKCYDVVTCCHVIEHTPDPVRFIKALGERVKSGGLLMMEVPNIMGLDLRLKRFLEVTGIKKTRVHRPGHLFEFTYRAFSNLVTMANLDVVACYTYSRYRRAPGFFKKLYQVFLRHVWTGNKFRFFLRKKAGA